MNITRAVVAGINLLDGKERLSVNPQDIEGLGELKMILKALANGELTITTLDQLKSSEGAGTPKGENNGSKEVN